jgi:ubiquitin carboxyl-terminal hydrolase 25
MNSCIGNSEQPFGPANITHHFHTYEHTIDAHHLMHPFNMSEWENEEHSKLHHHKMTLQGNKLTSVVTVLEQVLNNIQMDIDPEDSEGDLLDLYVYCQCSYMIALDVIPGVIPVKLLEDLVKKQGGEPTAG